MVTMFMNSENSKTCGSHRLLLNRSDKMNLKRSVNVCLYQTLVCIIIMVLYIEKRKKNSYKNNKFETSAPNVLIALCYYFIPLQHTLQIHFIINMYLTYALGNYIIYIKITNFVLIS